MKASELRVGNIVHFTGTTPGGKFDDVMPLSEHELFCGTFDPEKCAAVFLTDDWLHRLSFQQKSFNEWRGPSFSLVKPAGAGEAYQAVRYLKPTGGYYVLRMNVRYVHEVQNLHFALEGSELKITL